MDKPFAAALILTLTLSLCIAQNKPTEVEIFSDIPYKQTEADPNFTSLDVYTPKSDGSYPTVVYVHGGAWEFGDKRHVGLKPGYLARKGFVFVSVNHRLSPEYKHPTQVQDVADAIGWAYGNIGQYGGDKNKIFLMGHSSGAHLVSLLSTDERYVKKTGLDLSVIKGTVSLDCDFLDIPLSLEQEKAVEPLLHEVFGDDADAWKDASPIHHTERGKNIPPILLVYVDSREGVTGLQASLMNERLKESGLHSEIYEAPYNTHNSLDKRFGESYDPPTERIMEFMASILDKMPKESTIPLPAAIACKMKESLHIELIAKLLSDGRFEKWWFRWPRYTM